MRRGDGDLSGSDQETSLNDLNSNTERHVAEHHKDEETNSSNTGSSFGEGFFVDDEDSVMHDVNEDSESSTGGQNA